MAEGTTVVAAVQVAGRRALLLRLVVFVTLLAAFPLHVRAQAAPTWNDTYESRLEILALVQTLNGEILADTSATTALEKWCASHQMADVPKIVAHSIKDSSRPPDAAQMRRLGVTDASEVRHRHVQLRCGTHVLSEAHNWYVPARLTPEMNRLLETTDASFGTVVRPLRPYRRTFAVNMLWSALPPGWELRRRRWSLRCRRRLDIPKELFEHRAILYTSDHQPFSEVDEIYQRELLAFTRD